MTNMIEDGYYWVDMGCGVPEVVEVEYGIAYRCGVYGQYDINRFRFLSRIESPDDMSEIRHG